MEQSNLHTRTPFVCRASRVCAQRCPRLHCSVQHCSAISVEFSGVQFGRCIKARLRAACWHTQSLVIPRTVQALEEMVHKLWVFWIDLLIKWIDLRAAVSFRSYGEVRMLRTPKYHRTYGLLKSYGELKLATESFGYLCWAMSSCAELCVENGCLTV